MSDELKKQIKKENKELKELEKAKRKEEKLLAKERKKTKHEIHEEEKEEERNRPLTPKEAEIKKRNEPPHLSVLEEVGNSVTHGCGAIFAVIAIILMLTHSDGAREVVASLVYGISMFIMMLMSCLYHAWRSGSTVKRIWRRFDYSSIYLLIGGTFAPLQLINLYDIYQNSLSLTWGFIWFGIMWALIITGITFTCIFGPGRVRWINFPLYFTLGWSGLLFLPIWIINGYLPLLFWILGGGLVYTFGMIPFVKRGVPAAHFIWHFFVLAGAVTQFVGIFICVFM